MRRMTRAIALTTFTLRRSGGCRHEPTMATAPRHATAVSRREASVHGVVPHAARPQAPVAKRRATRNRTGQSRAKRPPTTWRREGRGMTTLREKWIAALRSGEYKQGH